MSVLMGIALFWLAIAAINFAILIGARYSVRLYDALYGPQPIEVPVERRPIAAANETEIRLAA
ncbi:hypothetical protein [Sphingomonas lenta]|nr:hypothetical protein [Sphingomonas lenta]